MRVVGTGRNRKRRLMQVSSCASGLSGLQVERAWIAVFIWSLQDRDRLLYIDDQQRMDAPLAKKTCKMCCLEIPEQARKCPHCHHFQNRWTMMMFHPGFAVLFFSLPLVAMMIVFSTVFDPGEKFETYKDQIVISDCRIALGDTKSAATVAVIGTIKNTSKVSWKDIKFHVDIFDAAGKLADVGQREEYSYGLAAGETSGFKVSFTREFPETNYVKPVVHIVGATDMRSRW